MVLLVIDVQKGITDQRLYNYEGFLANTKKLIDTARANQVEVIYVQHDDGPGTGFSVGDEEFEIADQVTPLTGEKIYYKTVNSAFGNKELETYLASQDNKDLMIVGLQTNFCIDATIKSAFDRG
ncbi:MAG: isochorismatase family protein, partial [Lachnospiraceae bacterium]|nr:isochorismatase family protein [Lachnospiraceae bacterium]